MMDAASSINLGNLRNDALMNIRHISRTLLVLPLGLQHTIHNGVLLHQIITRMPPVMTGMIRRALIIHTERHLARGAHPASVAVSFASRTQTADQTTFLVSTSICSISLFHLGDANGLVAVLLTIVKAYLHQVNLLGERFDKAALQRPSLSCRSRFNNFFNLGIIRFTRACRPSFRCCTSLALIKVLEFGSNLSTLERCHFFFHVCIHLGQIVNGCLHRRHELHLLCLSSDY
mmetsp:Transcript_23405/g.38585  ORF Transcript_23405/g.38585 Transcript_23405/m.38585 type:complete len:232 (-) Transcript_23405:398-1093(-)